MHSITHFLSLNHNFMHYLSAPTILIRKKLNSVEQALDSWMEFLWKKSNFQTRVSLILPKFSPLMPIISLFHRHDMFITLVPISLDVRLGCTLHTDVNSVSERQWGWPPRDRHLCFSRRHHRHPSAGEGSRATARLLVPERQRQHPLLTCRRS